MEHVQSAVDYFNEGYNCAQAVLLAYAQELGLDADAAARIASCFGGGMGRQGEVCGAVSAMFMVEGLRNGYTRPDKAAQEALYARVRALGKVFTEACGSLLCRDLLPAVATREQLPGGGRPCQIYVRAAAELLERTREA